MNFERSDILRPVLDALSAEDEISFRNLQQKMLAQAASTGMVLSSVAPNLIFQALRDQLTKRADDLLFEIKRVLEGAFIEDFDALAESLKSELVARLDSTASLASSKLLDLTEPVASKIDPRFLPTRTALSEHIAKLKPRLLAEIDLFCVKLHDSQAPRLFLKAGEVFAGNRAARAVFVAAKQSLDIIDTYFGPQVFDMLEVSPPSVRIRLISNSADGPTKLAFRLFNQQFNTRAEFRLCDRNTDRLHDRFVIVDDLRALHLGGSIKDLGTSDSLIDTAELGPHKERFKELWLKAKPVI